MTDPRFETESTDRTDLYYSGQVIDAFFADGEYGLSLNVVTRIDKPELFPFLTSPDHTRFFGLGRSQDGAWATRDGGATAVFVLGDGSTDPSKKIRANSAYGKLLNWFATHDEVGKAMPMSWSAKEAAGWKGLWIEWGEAEVPASRPKLDPNTGAQLTGKNGRPEFFQTTEKKAMPVEVRAGGASGASAATSAASVAGEGNGQVAESGGVFDLTTLPCDADTLGHLKAVALVANSHASAIGDWIKVEGVAGNKELMGVLTDGVSGPSVYAALKSAPAV